MFWIVGIALIASWVVAVVFTPYLGVKMLPDIKPVEGGHAAIYDTPHYNRFRRVLTRVIARKWWVAGAVITAFAVAIVGMGLVKTILPDVRSTGSIDRSADAVWHLD